MSAAEKLTRAEQKAQRRLEIVDAAFEEFAKNGFTATSVEDIAHRLNVTKGTVFIYFETKEELFRSTIENLIRAVQEVLDTYSGARKNPVEEIEAFLGFLSDAMVNDRKIRELLRLLLAEAPRFPELVDHYNEIFAEPVFSKINTILEDGVAKKMFSSKASQLAGVVMALLAGATVSRLISDARRTPEMEVNLSIHVKLVMRALLNFDEGTS
ncbi:TetR/AcrR family transcriptional regulator (plasmid) [Agrobacterium fabrum]|uniref:TetR/AcrR family transcriptional regulator n=1 Tax=Agrobacterium fabrum TaxID=1176649 RepID=UPI0021D208D2|nr:TetR/AcrR family transcriptional regulator [Agrobacterium fabrum]UXT61216.1 TetR/AcrR family transcriptional regulator [Agrobacterium fabrum]